MKPVSDCAFYTHLTAYLDEMHLFMPKRISSATCSAVAILQCDAHPDNAEDYFEEDEDFIDGSLRGIYEWANNHEGLLEYLKDRYVVWGHEDEESWLFYIGDTNECHYKNYEEFAADLDIEMIITIFNKCWERSSQFKFPIGRQLLKDYPEFKVDYSKNKKINGDELLSQIKKDIIPSYENIKKYGYISLNKNGEEIANLDEFLQEHRNALETAKNNGKEIKDHLLPSAQKIGKLSKGRYLIGDLARCLSIADKTLVDEIKTLERFRSFDDFDEDETLPIRIEDYMDYENKILEIKKIKKGNKSENLYLCGLGKKSDGSKFVYILPCIDESYFQDDNGGRYFQSSYCLVCIKVDDNYVNREANMHSYVFEEDFDCIYYESYDILKLGDFHVYANS